MVNDIGREAAYRTSTDKVFLFFIVFTSEGLDEPVRFVGSKEDYTVGGQDYIGYPFEISLPSDDGETISSVSLSIGNVRRELTQAIRSISETIYIEYWVALADDPETIQEGPFEMTLLEVTINALTITGSISTEALMGQGTCDYIMNPVTMPGLFKGVTADD